ncbi:hypothetical protein [Alkalihalobacillus deserti]|uniref:hypothetical protein n=1 Tax=Alkalihalobacillus deserti TaxID=2879466 RepID=UPI001D14F1D5|nr:hypothetical protein [Alkalihalobacillus deserti]
MTLDQIFDLITENFIFVALLIGGLISMFGRLTGAGQQQEQRPSRPQRSDAPQQEKVDWREIFKQEEVDPEPVQRRTSTNIEPPTQHVSFEEGVVGRQQELQNQYEEMQRKREVSSRKSKEIRKEASTSELEKKDKLDLHLNNLSNKEAMKAVVWAEVLGPPRSRQPHATFVKKR